MQVKGMLSSKLAEFILSTSYDQFPEEVTQKAKECFTDFLGVALSGSGTKSGEAVRSIIQPDGESTVVGHGRSSVQDASLANGVFSHSMDLDDGHRRAMLHPGACVIPAALSLCESQSCSGEKLIESMVVGYQVAIVLGIMVNPPHRNRGFHSTGTCGTLGAAAAACKALDLGREEITNALGLAGTQAAGLLESDHSGSMGKHLHAGKAAQSGVLSALLARNGFTGSETILDGKEGFIKAMAGIDPAEIELNSYMENYKISEVYFKIYPVCRHLHSSIDALLNIIRENQVELEDIEEITVHTYRIAAEHNDYHPTTTEAVRQSLPVSMALSLLNSYHGSRSLIEFTYSHLDQRDINDITRKIVLKTDADMDSTYPQSRPSEVSVRTNTGMITSRVDLPRGEPENPLKKADLEWKFRNLNPEVDVTIFERIEKMNSYEDVKQFIDDLISSI